MTTEERASHTIKVLSVQHYPGFGGPHNEIIKLEPYLNDIGVETVVAITDSPGDAAGRIEGHARLHRIPLTRFRASYDPRLHARTLGAMRSDVQQLRQLIVRENVDVVKVHGPHNPQGAIAAWLEKKPITWVLSSTQPAAWARHLGMSYVRRMADSLLVNGPSLLKFYRLGGDFRGKVFFYFPPVDSDVFRPVSSEERIRSKMNWGYPADTRLVGTVANITPQKGIDLFANMVAEVHHRRPDVRFMVVGGPTAAHQAYYHRVLSHAAELGLSEETLRFVGARADVQDIVPMWDVKVIASRAEGTTATAGEALACGVPVIARDVGAICDVVEHGLTGLLVSTESPLALSTAVLQLLDDPGSRHSMGLNGRMRALESFSTFQCARTHRSAYESAILHRSRRRSVPHNNQGERL